MLVECGKTVLVYRGLDGAFDTDSALEFLIDKYGVAESESEKDVTNLISDDEKEHDEQHGETLNKSPTKKRKSSSGTDKTSGEKPKKAKKSETYKNEANKEVGDAILEMASIYFRTHDARKGGVFSKAAKAIRDCETKLTTKKEAMGLPGVGKSIAEYMDEMRRTGMIQRLEEMRAGIA